MESVTVKFMIREIGEMELMFSLSSDLPRSALVRFIISRDCSIRQARREIALIEHAMTNRKVARCICAGSITPPRIARNRLDRLYRPLLIAALSKTDARDRDATRGVKLMIPR